MANWKCSNCEKKVKGTSTGTFKARMKKLRKHRKKCLIDNPPKKERKTSSKTKRSKFSKDLEKLIKKYF